MKAKAVSFWVIIFAVVWVDDIVFLVNGHFFRGLGCLVVDFFKSLSANKSFMKKLEK